MLTGPGVSRLTCQEIHVFKKIILCLHSKNSLRSFMKSLLDYLIIVIISWSFITYHRVPTPSAVNGLVTSLSAINFFRVSNRPLFSKANMSSKKGKAPIGSKSQQGASTSSVHYIASEHIPTWMNTERTNILTYSHGITEPHLPSSMKKNELCVYYWMQRDVRAVDNWALLYSEYLAKKYQVPLRVVYTLPPPPSKPSVATSESLPPKVYDMNMTHRHGMFLIDGLQQVSKQLFLHNTPLDILFPTSRDNVGSCLYQHVCPNTSTSPASGNKTHSPNRFHAIAVVCDMNPLRHVREWMEDQAAPLLAQASIPLYQVDSHNIVPVWYASDKREVGARTLRPRIHRHLEQFLTHYPTFHGNQHISTTETQEIQDSFWDQCQSFLSLDSTVQLPPHYTAGTEAAMQHFRSFCQQGLKVFDTQRNDPNFSSVCSNLSPWINYGHVSFQRLALETRALKKYPNGTAAYLEEGIVRRELSDNFCYYTKNDYDSLSAAAGWALETLRVHEADAREYIYSLDEFERGFTHDELWNAAQLQVVREGKMHGFMRMYWAKKILEWTPSPDIALRTAQYLNDRFALDGNDPNGFVGVGWSIMGIHDMGWTERAIFGKIRFMNYDGCKRKFKIASFVAKYPGALDNSLQVNKRKNTSGVKRKVSPGIEFYMQK